MPIKTYRPTTQTLRYRTTLVNDDITTKHPHKPLVEPKQRTGGRRNSGDMTMRHHRWRPQAQAAHHRLQARQDRDSGDGDDDRIRSEPLVAHCAAGYADGEKRYILQPEGLKVGQKIVSGPMPTFWWAMRFRCATFLPGTQIHNIELKPGKGGQMVRSAGGSAQLVAKEGEYALVKLPSGETRKVSQDCMATIGQVGNIDHENVTIGKAGRSRWLGMRPHNRGVSMNPVDHPHGGGEGKTSGGRHPVTPWGQPTRGYKTRNNKRTDKFIVSRRASKSEFEAAGYVSCGSGSMRRRSGAQAGSDES